MTALCAVANTRGARRESLSRVRRASQAMTYKMAPPRSAFGASPSRGRHQRPGKAGSAVALERGPTPTEERFYGFHQLPEATSLQMIWISES
jgi:hypothetical protein